MKKIILTFIALAILISSCSPEPEDTTPPVSLPKDDVPILQENNEVNEIVITMDTSYIRPDIIDATQKLSEYTAQLNIAEQEISAINATIDFINLYEEIVSMRDLLLCRYMLDTSDSDLAFEANYWANYQKELNIALEDMARAIKINRHSAAIKTALGEDYHSYLLQYENITEENIYYGELLESYIYFSNNEYVPEVFWGEVSEYDFDSEYFMQNLEIYTQNRKDLATDLGYANYVDYTFKNRRYTKGQLDTLSLITTEYYSPILTEDYNYSYDLGLIYSEPSALYNIYSTVFKTIGSTHEKYLTQTEDYKLIDEKNSAVGKVGAINIMGSDYAYISSDFNWGERDIRNMSYSLGEGYYYFTTKSTPNESEKWLSESVAKCHIYTLQRFYEFIYPTQKEEAILNDFLSEMKLTMLAVLTYELEKYIYTSESVEGIEEEFNRLYDLHISENDSEAVREAGFAMALYNILYHPFDSADEMISGVLALEFGMIAHGDSSAAMRKLNSLMVANTTLPIESALSKISQPSPFGAVTVSTTAYFVQSLLSPTQNAVHENDITTEKWGEEVTQATEE